MEERELAKLKANPHNPRGAITHDIALRELAMSIKTQGVLQPLLVTPSGYIIAGHRRAEAAKLAGLKTVPVIQKEMSPAEQVQVMLIENLQRADLTVLQEGAAYVWLISQGLTASQLGKALGMQTQRISDCVAVQSLPAHVQQSFAMNLLPLSCASPLAALSNDNDKLFWSSEAVRNKLNGVALRNAIDREGKSQRRVVKNPEQLVAHFILQLKRIDEKLDYDEGLREVQVLLRQAVRLLQKKRQVEGIQAGDDRKQRPWKSTVQSQL